MAKRGGEGMSKRSNKSLMPEAKAALNNFKNEVASELGVNLKKENLTTKEAGKVGGEMVKRMVESYQNKNK